jgi:hypothetical protein
MDASNLKRMSADWTGVDPSAFFPTNGAKEEEQLWNVVIF